MSSQQENTAPPLPVPITAARYKAASTSAHTRQQLARAMANLQQAAANAVFPRAVETDDGAEAPTTSPQARARRGNLELSLMSQPDRPATSCREASRLYTGAKSIL
jgi:hypothetical protein